MLIKQLSSQVDRLIFLLKLSMHLSKSSAEAHALYFPILLTLVARVPSEIASPELREPAYYRCWVQS